MSKLKLKQLKRLEMRRTPGWAGIGPDDTDRDLRGSNQYAGVRVGTECAFNFKTGNADLYSEYQAELCRQGIPLQSDHRGLPAGYATGSTWIRAKQSQTQHKSK